MSTQQRTAHLTGFNNDIPGQLPERGSFYAPVGGGAPGFLGGPASGFTIAFTAFNKYFEGNDIWGDEDSQGGTQAQILAICVGDPGTDGWQAEIGGTQDIQVLIGDGMLAVGDSGIYEQDILVVVSYIPDASLYGGNQETLAVSSLNGDMQSGNATGLTTLPGAQFSLLGTAFDFQDTNISGCRYAQLGSFWLTPGIPNQLELQDFVQASMMAGEVVPAPWAVARTAANLEPATPDSPTGHHWSANDVDITQGLGGTWTDRIGGVVLERVGTISGIERELARDPYYYFPNPGAQ